MKLASLALMPLLSVTLSCGPGKNNPDWVATPCEVISSRVVRSDGVVGPHATPTVGYRGEYGLSWTIHGKRYFRWESAGLWDPEEKFIQSKVATLPNPCPFVVRYNPESPTEVAIAWE
jgi:hypothetical protein